MRLIICVFGLFAGVLYTATSQDTVRISLRQAIEIGTGQSVDAVVARNEFISAYWEYRTFRTELLPEVTLKATTPYFSKTYERHQAADGTYTYVGTNYNRIDAGLEISQNIPFTGGRVTFETSSERMRQNGTDASTRWRTTPFAFTLEQPVFGFNRLKWLRQIEPVKYRVARKKLDSDREEVALNAIVCYFDLLLGRINLEIARQNRENAELLYIIAQARHEMGQMSEIEVMQLSNSLLKAESSVTTMRSSFDSRMFALKSFLGITEDVVLEPEIPEPLAETFPHLNYDEVLQLSLTNYYFSDDLRRRMLEASRQVSQAKADRRSINLYASFGVSAQETSFGRAYRNGNWRDDQVISVGLSIPILDWGKGKGKVRTAEANREVVQSRIQKEEQDFRQNIYMQVMNFNNQPEQLRLALETDRIAERRYETTLEAYILGKIDILTLNDAQGSKDEARRDYINQMYNLWLYYYELRSLTLHDFVTGQSLVSEYEYGR